MPFMKYIHQSRGLVVRDGPLTSCIRRSSFGQSMKEAEALDLALPRNGICDAAKGGSNGRLTLRSVACLFLEVPRPF
jgi:hypothetical protein